MSPLLKIQLKISEEQLKWVDEEIKRHGFLSRSEYFDTLIQLARENQRSNNQYDPRQPAPENSN